MSRRYWIETWGCQMNVRDSEQLAGALDELGLEPAASAPEADVVLLNTCAIREKAEQKVYGYLARLQGRGDRPAGALVGVVGCVAQLAGEGVRRRAPYVDLVLGPRAKGRLPERLAEALEKRGVVDTGLTAPAFPLTVSRRCAGPGPARPSSRSWKGATRSAPTASSRRPAGARRAALSRRSSRKSGRSPSRGGSRSSFSGRTSTPGAARRAARASRTCSAPRVTRPASGGSA